MEIQKHEGKELYFLLDVSSEELFILRQALSESIEKRTDIIFAKKTLYDDRYSDQIMVNEYSKLLEVIDKSY